MNRQELENIVLGMIFYREFTIPNCTLDNENYKKEVASGIEKVINIQKSYLNNMPNKKSKKYQNCLNTITLLNEKLELLQG